MNVTPESISNEKISMQWFASVLGGVLGRPVVDRTGFTGSFKVRLEFAPVAPGGDTDSTRPSIFAALEEQLGLQTRVPERHRGGSRHRSCREAFRELRAGCYVAASTHGLCRGQALHIDPTCPLQNQLTGMFVRHCCQYRYRQKSPAERVTCNPPATRQPSPCAERPARMHSLRNSSRWAYLLSHC